MPELPEVETIRFGLESLIGKKVTKIFRSNKKLRIESALNLKDLEGSKINSIDRRARYLIINFNNKKSLVIHLGMSGRLVFSDDFSGKHNHFIMEFNQGPSLIFNDPRRFGFIDLVETNSLQNHKSLANLGPEPLSPEFNAKYLAKKLSNKKMNIKTTMMDNEIVVGVGNIYISESLFDAKISPLRSSSLLTIDEIKKLTSSIKKILKKAIEAGGSSISDYVKSDGEIGNFQNNFNVYGREGKKCLLCKNLIRKIVQNGRSSFYCQQCQE